ILARLLGTEAHVGVGGEMEHDLGAGHGAAQGGGVERIAFDKRELRMLRGVVEKRALSGGEVVVGDHGVALGEQPIDDRTTNTTGAASDKCVHAGAYKRIAPGAAIRLTACASKRPSSRFR